MQIGFIGNSYTSYNDLPGLFKSLCIENGKQVDIRMVVRENETLEGHFCSDESLRAIEQMSPDFIVMQEQSTRPIFDYSQMKNKDFLVLQ